MTCRSRLETAKTFHYLAADMTDGDGPADTDDLTQTAAERVEGTFLVTHAGDDSAVLKDAEGGRVHTLAENPGVEVGDVLEAILSADPPIGVVWRLVEIRDRWSFVIRESPERPTRQASEAAAAQAVGEVTVLDRAGDGELHVITVPDDETEQAVADVLDDEATRIRAARLGVSRVEVRSDTGLVSVRYLP